MFHKNWKLVRMELRFPNKPLPKLLIFSFVEGISMTKIKKYHFVGMCWMMWIIMNCCNTTNPSIYGCEIQNKCLLENISLPASISCNVKQDLGLYSFKKFSIVPQESLTFESENKLFQYLAACMDNTFLWRVFSVYSHSLASNSHVLFKVCHFIDSSVMRFPSSKQTCEICKKLCKSPVRTFVKCTVTCKVVIRQCNQTVGCKPTPVIRQLHQSIITRARFLSCY